MPAASHPEPVPSWLLNEVAFAGRENLDPEHVARYDDKEDARAEEEIAVCQALGIGASATVGTGQFTTAVASMCARVVAVDVSAVMQDRLRTKLNDGGITNVELVQAGFLTYRHTGEPADLVYSRYALHHLPDFWKAVALDRIHGMIRPGGFLRLSDVVFSFEPGDAAERIERWCATGGPRVADAWSRAELEEHVRDEHSTFSWILEPMAVRCGFIVESAEYSDDQILAKYILRRT